MVIFIPYVLAGVGAYYKNRQFGTIDTHHPRAQAAALEGADAAASVVASVGIVCCVRLFLLAAAA
ncbi:MAG: hypothetical protein E4H03_11980 [Myxococcales bacterium]|nr:MAG: hypothetical protein E4H03_11980 [Myxococcales bacterium]